MRRFVLVVDYPYQIDFDLLRVLAAREHPLLNIAEDFESQIRSIPLAWIGEVFQEARSAHHLLDMAQIPQRLNGRAYDADLDSRTYLAVMELIDLRQQIL